MSSWSVDPVGGWWFILLVGMGLAAVLSIAPREDKLTPRRRRILFALRTATALLLVVAMLRPTLVTTEIQKLPGTLVLLADSSRSMTIADAHGDVTRWEALKSSLAAARREFSDLAESWDLKLYQFDEDV